ncbi:MAG: DUF378 domain-containing protein [Anaeromyxobacter sp.]
MAKHEGRNAFAQLVLWLSIIGALNWGLVGFFDFDLVRALFGSSSSTPSSAVARAVYALVGLAGLALAFVAPRLRTRDTTLVDARRDLEARQHT